MWKSGSRWRALGETSMCSLIRLNNWTKLLDILFSAITCTQPPNNNNSQVLLR